MRSTYLYQVSYHRDKSDSVVEEDFIFGGGSGFCSAASDGVLVFLFGCRFIFHSGRHRVYDNSIVETSFLMNIGTSWKCLFLFVYNIERKRYNSS